MPFAFASNALVDPVTFSRYFFGSDDASVDMSTSEKMIVEMAMNAGCQQILDYLGRELKSSTYEETFDGQVSDQLLTREYPIRSVTWIRYQNADSEFTQVPAQEIGFDESAIYLRSGLTPRGRKIVRVRYEAGYPTIPYNVQMAALIQYQMLRKISNPGGGGQPSADMGYSSISKMGEQVSKDQKISEFGLASEVVGLIKQYRRMEAPLSVMFMRVS